MKMRFLASVAGAALAAFASTSAVSADSVAEFYKGRTVTIVIAAGPGGAHMQYSQLLAPFLQKYMPGNPNFITQNMGGAGGTKAANYLFTPAPKDGTVIGMLLSDTPLASRLQAVGIKYVANEFQFLGGADQPQSGFVVLRSGGVLSIDDARKKELLLGSTGKGSQTYVVPMIYNALLGTKFKVITGYRGMGAIYLAMDQQEVFGFQTAWESIKFLRPQWVENDQITVLTSPSLTPVHGHPETPLLKDLVTDPVDRQIAELVGGASILGRGWLAPPDVPADRVAALREAFEKAFKDPEAMAIAKERQMTWDNARWQDMQAQADLITRADKAVIEKMQAALGID